MVEKLSQEEYDKLSEDEQKAHDSALADQQSSQQAGERQ